MREIKFRGKRIDNGEWVYGYYGEKLNVYTGNYVPFIICSDYHGVTNLFYFVDYEVIPETIGQYTGLKDINRKEIYEGDIIKVKQKYHEREDVGKVYFDEFAWFGAKDYLSYVDEFCSVKVIGTIYD